MPGGVMADGLTRLHGGVAVLKYLEYLMQAGQFDERANAVTGAKQEHFASLGLGGLEGGNQHRETAGIDEVHLLQIEYQAASSLFDQFYKGHTRFGGVSHYQSGG